MRPFRFAPTVCLTLLLAACGGGGPGEPVDGSALARPQGTAEVATCLERSDGRATGLVGYQMLGEACVKTFAPLATGVRKLARAAQPQSATAFTWTTLIPWAEQTYPQFFSGSSQSGTYGEFTYRYYPATGNYIGLRNGDMVYVHGPLVDNDLLYVGTFSTLASQAGSSAGGSSGSTSGGTSTGGTSTGGASSGGDVPGSSATTARLAAGSPVSSSIGSSGDDDWFIVTLVANTVYTFDLQGASSGGGTLDDPIVRILSASGAQLDSHDDISYPTNRDARLVYRAASSGTHYISARGYSSDTGSYQLTMSGGATGGTSGTSTGGSGSATGGTGSTGGSTTGSGGIRIAPTLSWNVRLSPAFETYSLKLCWGGSSCEYLGADIIRDRSLNDSISSTGFANGIRWTTSSPVQVSSLTTLINGLQDAISDVYTNRSITPNANTVINALNTALANGSSPSDVIARARSAFTRAGYLGGTSSGTTGGTGGSGTGTGSGSASGGSCDLAGYAGPRDDPQTWTICATAYSHQCNGDAANAARMCTYLTDVLRAYGSSRTAAQYCSAYCR